MHPGFEPVLEKETPVRPNSPASKASAPFLGGDRIVGINEAEIRNFADLDRALAGVVDEAVTITVERTDAKTQKAERLKIQVEPAPRRYLGLIMTWGGVRGVQEESAARQAGHARTVRPPPRGASDACAILAM